MVIDIRTILQSSFFRTIFLTEREGGREKCFLSF